MFPPDVFELLQFDLLGAAMLAAKGDIVGGYEMLTPGLQRAEARRHLGADQPWSKSLRRCYQQALVNYEQRYGAPLARDPALGRRARGRG